MLGEEFSEYGAPRAVSGASEQFVRRPVFEFFAEAEDGHHEDEESEDARDDDVGEIDAIVQPRIPDGVHVDDHGLEKCHRLSFGGAASVEHGACRSAGNQFRESSHVTVEQGARHEVGIARVERDGGHSLCHGVAPGSFWDDIEAVDVSALHVPSSFCRVGIGRQRVWHLERLQRADDVSGCGAAVLVHNSQRQLFRKSLLHQRREKEAAEEREDHGATQKERAAEQLLRLRHKHFPKAFSDLFHVSERQCRGFDNIENSAAGGSL